MTRTETSPPGRRRRLKKVLLTLLLLAALSWWMGCTATVVPPIAPEEPTSVYYVADALHRGLVLPRPEGGFVEFGYGEWAWYAQGHTSWYRVFPTLLWPTAGCLGYRELDVEDAAALRRRLHWLELQELVVPGERMRELRGRLRAAWEEGRGEHDPETHYGFRFVPAPKGYWLLHNCTDRVAEWMEELGCRVSWVLVRIDLEIAER